MISKGRRLFTAVFVTAFALSTSLVWAQTSTGSIVGTVSDASGAAIPGASVTLTNTGTAERRTLTSDSSGNYQFVNLLPGSYKLEVENRGFKRYSREGIRV
ncbi:MAG: carboxypeptidase regulatory-like domain-containing protein, partial [Acidobacteriaceae bacterium]|nr:carboxypeptidase regulatory-like domain-containing protein [Acidobacteriaceae bacterium]